MLPSSQDDEADFGKVQVLFVMEFGLGEGWVALTLHVLLVQTEFDELCIWEIWGP